MSVCESVSACECLCVCFTLTNARARALSLSLTLSHSFTHFLSHTQFFLSPNARFMFTLFFSTSNSLAMIGSPDQAK